MLKLESVRLVYCYFGSGIALGAYGTKEDIDTVLDGLYNYEGHDDDNCYLCDNFGYVLTTKERLLRGLANSVFTQLVAENQHLPRADRKKIWEEAQSYADVEALAILSTIEHEPFLTGSSPAREYVVASLIS